MATDIRIKETLPDLTDRIVETYTQLDTITHLGHCPLPNYETIVEILASLKDIIYPGYRRRDGLHMGNVTYHVGELIDRLHDQLTEQIARALRHEAGEAFKCSPQQQGRLRGPGPGQGRGLPGADCPTSANCWPPTCRPPTTATRPASRWTR